MPRVTNQTTRQYILVEGDPLDLDGPLPDMIQLFNEDGEALMIGGGGTRDEFEYTTGSIAAGAYEEDILDLFPSVRLFRIATDIPARVRVYASTAQRDADADRPIGTLPSGDHGRLFEFVTTDDDLDWTLSPAVDMSSYDDDGNFGITVTNLTDSTDTVTVTFHYVRTE